MSSRKIARKEKQSESNVRQIRLNEERETKLLKIKKNPLFKNFVSENSDKIKFTKLVDFLLDKALNEPALFFQNQMFENKEDLLTMIEDITKALQKVNELQLELFKEVFMRLDDIPKLNSKLNELVKHFELNVDQDQIQESQQGDNIFDNEDSLSIDE